MLSGMTLKEINNLIFPDIKDASITPIAITEIRERLYQSLKLPENNKNTAIMRNIYECIKNSFCKYCGNRNFQDGKVRAKT